MDRHAHLYLAVNRAPRSPRPDYDWYLFAAACYLLLGAVEMGGSVMSGSLIILADAIHVLIDALVMGLSAYVDFRAGRTTHFFHAKRFFTRGTLINGLLLVLGGILVLMETIPKLNEGLIAHAVNPHRALWVIAIALPAHLVILLLILNRVGADHHGAGLKQSASWHAIEDVAITAIALASVGLIEHTSTSRWDLYLSSIVAGVFIARGVVFVYRARNQLVELRRREAASSIKA